jgi:molybdopterin synthase catalytic subunit
MLREQAGVTTVELSHADAPTAGAAATRAAAAVGIGELFAQMRVAIAVNRIYADDDTPLRDGDEVALIPPVSGGSGERIHVSITDEPLSLDRLVGLVRDPGAGAIVTFQGEPRDVDVLDYEAYTEMAHEQMRAILADLITTHGLIAAAASHRIGPVPIGEPCVIVAVSAAHRPQAFDGAREAMDRIKADVPIWKREVDGDRVRWVVPDDSQVRS